LFSQNFSAETRKNEISNKNKGITATYNSIISDDYEFLDGKSYFIYPEKYNHPYLNENKWYSGQITYKGNIHQINFLRYDVLADKLIILFEKNGSTYIVALNKDFLDAFSIETTSFVRIDSLKGINKVSGYFEKVYDNETKLYIKHTSKVEITSESSKYRYTKNEFLYLENKGIYYKIISKSSLLKALEDKKPELKKYLKGKQYIFSKYETYPIIKILIYYDEIK
jgi:hypothetical protein